LKELRALGEAVMLVKSSAGPTTSGLLRVDFMGGFQYGFAKRGLLNRGRPIWGCNAKKKAVAAGDLVCKTGEG